MNTIPWIITLALTIFNIFFFVQNKALKKMVKPVDEPVSVVGTLPTLPPGYVWRFKRNEHEHLPEPKKLEPDKGIPGWTFDNSEHAVWKNQIANENDYVVYLCDLQTEKILHYVDYAANANNGPQTVGIRQANKIWENYGYLYSNELHPLDKKLGLLLGDHTGGEIISI